MTRQYRAPFCAPTPRNLQRFFRDVRMLQFGKRTLRSFLSSVKGQMKAYGWLAFTCDCGAGNKSTSHKWDCILRNECCCCCAMECDPPCWEDENE